MASRGFLHQTPVNKHITIVYQSKQLGTGQVVKEVKGQSSIVVSLDNKCIKWCHNIQNGNPVQLYLFGNCLIFSIRFPQCFTQNQVTHVPQREVGVIKLLNKELETNPGQSIWCVLTRLMKSFTAECRHLDLHGSDIAATGTHKFQQEGFVHLFIQEPNDCLAKLPFEDFTFTTAPELMDLSMRN
jgi:hypothetical protein